MKKDLIKILFFGDIVGRNARNKIISVVYEMREEFGCDFVVANCENAAGAWPSSSAACKKRTQRKERPRNQSSDPGSAGK